MDIAETIRTVIANQVQKPVEAITEDSKLAEIGLDSLDLLEVIYEIETQLKVDLPYNPTDPGALAMTTVGEVSRRIEAELRGER